MAVRWLMLLAALAPAWRAEAGQATCSNPGVPVGATASSELMPGRLTLQLTAGLLPIHVEQTLAEAEGPVRYDTRLMLVETRLAAEYAVTSWLAIGAALPFRVVDVDVAYRDPDTGIVVPMPSSAIHARAETLRGLGDPTLAVHAVRELGRIRLHARVGTSLPIGRTEEDPFVLGAIGEKHEHLQLGTGTFVPFASAEAQREVSRVTVAGWALVQLSLYTNGNGYRTGDRFSAGINASTTVGRAWTFGVALEGHGETAETWHGIVHEDEGNTGRFDLLVGASAAWRPMPGLAVVADVKVPVYSHVTGTQLDYGIVIGLGVATTFDLRRRASWRGLDRAVVGPPGTAPELQPVAGKLTVFDLWASWCAPCRELDDRLHALARAHPDRLVVRALDVIDADSAAWQRYLAPGRFELPHVKVYGPDGALLFERTAPPAELAAAIEATLR